MALQTQPPVPSLNRNFGLLGSPTRPKFVVRFQKPSGRSVSSQKNHWIFRPSPVVEKAVEERGRFSSYLGWDRSSNVWMGIDKDLIPTITLLVVTSVLSFVGIIYLRYLEAKWQIEDSEELMRNTLKDLEAIPKDRWHKYGSHMFVLERWGKMRKEAAAYMEKHKLIGKIVEFFHPKPIDNS